MKFEAVTIKDIAKQLGLSTSTISRALRDSYEISAETKKLVLECADKLQYRPNPIALSLKEKRSRSIGVIVCEIDNSFFSQAINGIESIAYNKGYNVIISQSHESFERELSDLDFLTSRSIDGLIISVSSATQTLDHLQNLLTRGLPIVFFDRIAEELNTHKVIVDNFKAAYQATTHLIQQGFKNIACVLTAMHLYIAKERVAGYRQSLVDHGIPENGQLIKSCSFGGAEHQQVEEVVTELLQLQPRPDAIVAMSDKLTTGCLRVLRANNIKVPDEMGLIGFSNSDLTEMFNPALSAIRQPAFEMGEIATQLLIDLVERKRPATDFKQIVLETMLLVKQSSQRNPVV